MVNLEEYNTLTHQVIGCAMRVHSSLGNGFPEKIYQRALAIEFEKAGVAFEREKSQEIFYEGEMIGTRRVDFLVENRVLVELKATSDITNNNLNQVINYLKAFDLEVGLLINFGAERLFHKRFLKA